MISSYHLNNHQHRLRKTSMTGLRQWRVGGECFLLNAKYEVRGYLGSGAYGVVCSARDVSTNRDVAIKKCKSIFNSRTMAKRTLRELRLLRLLKHQNIISTLSIETPASIYAFDDIYIQFELMETDLACIIKSSQKLSNEHVQYFTYQILSGIHYLHENGVLHRDLKPRNILINSDCTIKISDFGLSKHYTEHTGKRIPPMTEYVTTRWYRAPEILVGWHDYGYAVDLWAVGTIMAELVARKPLFPGADSFHQLELIVNFTGNPGRDFMSLIRKPHAKFFLQNRPDVAPVNYRCVFPRASRNFLDLLGRLLQVHPTHRISAMQALKHPYIQILTKSQTVVDVTPIESMNVEFDFEKYRLDMDELRREILVEVAYYNPEINISSLNSTSDTSPISWHRTGTNHDEPRSVPDPLLVQRNNPSVIANFAEKRAREINGNCIDSPVVSHRLSYSDSNLSFTQNPEPGHPHRVSNNASLGVRPHHHHIRKHNPYTWRDKRHTLGVGYKEQGDVKSESQENAAFGEVAQDTKCNMISTEGISEAKEHEIRVGNQASFDDINSSNMSVLSQVLTEMDDSTMCDHDRSEIDKANQCMSRSSCVPSRHSSGYPPLCSSDPPFMPIFPLLDNSHQNTAYCNAHRTSLPNFTQQTSLPQQRDHMHNIACPQSNGHSAFSSNQHAQDASGVSSLGYVKKPESGK